MKKLNKIEEEQIMRRWAKHILSVWQRTKGHTNIVTKKNFKIFYQELSRLGLDPQKELQRAVEVLQACLSNDEMMDILSKASADLYKSPVFAVQVVKVGKKNRLTDEDIERLFASMLEVDGHDPYNILTDLEKRYIELSKQYMLHGFNKGYYSSHYTEAPSGSGWVNQILVEKQWHEAKSETGYKH